MTTDSMGLRELNLKEQYRSDKDDIITEFFFPCLSHCIEYDRCVDYLSVKSLTTLAIGFDNFAAHKAKMRVITGHRYRASDLEMITKLFSPIISEKIFNGNLIRDSKLQKLRDIVKKKQIELKVAIPNSEVVAGNFSERIGIFIDEKDDTVAFNGTSSESFTTQIRNFESVDVFTSWNDKTRVDRKIEDFEYLWKNETKYVEVYDFAYAEKNNLLKYSTEWATAI